jgi:hypothetical protein
MSSGPLPLPVERACLPRFQFDEGSYRIDGISKRLSRNCMREPTYDEIV